jgi:RNA polymerase sigma-70 factor (ECF subfamily)
LSAFERLVVRYERHIWTLAKRLVHHDQDAEDVTQNSFLTALEHLGELRDGDRFKAWLVQIATRHALRVLERRKRVPRESLDELIQEAPDEGGEAIPHPEVIADWRARLQLREKLTRYFGDEAKRLMPHPHDELIPWVGEER